jgi:hypothetical protein
MQHRTHFGRVAGQLALLAVVGTALLNYNVVLDEYAVRTFHPSPALASIENRLGLTPGARAVFYRSQPKLDDKASFNADCETQKNELELGCYYRGNIYVLQIDNASLAPEMDVVTAHELLHAAWTRLTPAERSRLGAELQRVYAATNDAELRQRMDGYAKSEPGQEDNELHSILATEYTSLSPMLEEHYRKYFTNRAAIVAAHQSYQNVFNTRRQELERELATIRGLKGQLASVNSQMSSYRAAGEYDKYNALVPRQNRLVDDINRRIEVYRRGVDEYNALSRSLDSQVITDTESGVSQ